MAREKMADKIARLQAENDRLGMVEIFARNLAAGGLKTPLERVFAGPGGAKLKARHYHAHRLDQGWIVILADDGGVWACGGVHYEIELLRASGDPYLREIASWLDGNSRAAWEAKK